MPRRRDWSGRRPVMIQRPGLDCWYPNRCHTIPARFGHSPPIARRPRTPRGREPQHLLGCNRQSRHQDAPSTAGRSDVARQRAHDSVMHVFWPGVDRCQTSAIGIRFQPRRNFDGRGFRFRRGYSRPAGQSVVILGLSLSVPLVQIRSVAAWTTSSSGRCSNASAISESSESEDAAEGVAPGSSRSGMRSSGCPTQRL